MNKKNFITRNNQGSALVVTIMLTSVMLVLAIVVLQRIIPYSKQVRDMQGSAQAYYTANSEIEKSLSLIGLSPVNSGIAGGNTVTLPLFDATNPGSSAVIARGSELPLAVQLYTNDDAPMLFGTSKKDATKHTLPILGSLTFDMSDVETSAIGFDLSFATDTTQPLGIEFVHEEGGTVSSFFGTITSSPSINIDLTNALDATGGDLKTFFTAHDCVSQQCSLQITQQGGTSPLDFTLSTSSTVMPDLNTVIVADGFSENGAYHARIIETRAGKQGI